MEEIVPHIFHWATFHPDIEQRVDSYCVTGEGPVVLIDPMYPADGFQWFHRHVEPAHILLTNRLHYRGSDRFADEFGTKVWCHKAGLHEFEPNQKVHGFEHGDELPGGILALKVDALCPEETAFLIPRDTGALSIGDAVIRENEHLEFVPDEFMGDVPEGVKRGLRSAFKELLKRQFEHLLLAHGCPYVKNGKEALREITSGKAAAHHK